MDIFAALQFVLLLDDVPSTTACEFCFFFSIISSICVSMSNALIQIFPLFDQFVEHDLLPEEHRLKK
jgi:hypothetical protein